MVVEVRILGAGDEAELSRLLNKHLASSVTLLASSQKAGIVDQGQRFQATYAGSFDASGSLTAVAAHSVSGSVLVQGGVGLEQAAQLAAERSGRAVKGLIGPWAQVERVRGALDLRGKPTRLCEREVLYSLALSDLIVPELLSRPGIEWRPARADEAASRLAAWRVEYSIEALGSERSEELEISSRELMVAWCADLSVLTIEGEPVAMTGFNARVRDVVQVGNVYTPPELRSRGYARAAVAGSLRAARANGAQLSTLFTGEQQHAARRAYEALGYQAVGDYGIVLF